MLEFCVVFSATISPKRLIWESHLKMKRCVWRHAGGGRKSLGKRGRRGGSVKSLIWKPCKLIKSVIGPRIGEWIWPRTRDALSVAARSLFLQWAALSTQVLNWSKCWQGETECLDPSGASLSTLQEAPKAPGASWKKNHRGGEEGVLRDAAFWTWHGS